MDCPRCTGEMKPHSRHGYPATCRTCDYRVYTKEHYTNAVHYYSINKAVTQEISKLIINYDDIRKEDMLISLQYILDLLQ